MKAELKKTSITNRIIWITAVFILGVLAGDLAAIGGLELFDRLTDIRSSAVVFIVECYMCLAFSVLVFVLFCRFTRKNRFILEGMLPKNDRKFLSRFGVGVLLGFLSNFFCILCALLNGDIKLVWDFSISGIPVMLLAFIAVFFQSVNEEVWCRGFMYERISIHYPLWVAILVNSVVFGLLHIFNDGVTALAIASIIMCGLAYSLLRWYTGSIWTAFGIHTMWNFTQNFIFGLPNSGLVSEVSMFRLDAASAIDSLTYNYEFGVEAAWPALFIDSLIAIVIIVLACRNGRIRELTLSKEMLGYKEPEPRFIFRRKRDSKRNISSNDS
jgi:membrane protease YdiL (CAAX protease family)